MEGRQTIVAKVNVARIPHRVIVVGSAGHDLVLNAPRHPRPGETVIASNIDYFPGGKGANQAAAARCAGATTFMAGAVGDDEGGNRVRRLFERVGVDTRYLATDPHTPTQLALIVVDEAGENSIVVAPGASGALTPKVLASVVIDQGDIVVCQCEIPINVVHAAFSRARDSGATTVLNCAPALALGEEILALVDILVVNESEAAFLTGLDPSATADSLLQGLLSLPKPPTRGVVLTLGAAGSAAQIDGRRHMTQAPTMTVVDTTGAGDCFVGYLAAGLAAELPMEAILPWAHRAASISVGTRGAGTSLPSLPLPR